MVNEVLSEINNVIMVNEVLSDIINVINHENSFNVGSETESIFYAGTVMWGNKHILHTLTLLFAFYTARWKQCWNVK